MSSETVYCSSGSFYGYTPTCNPNPCYSQYSPAPTNGYITSGTPYYSGNSVTFACNSGYQLVGASNGIKCNLGSFVANPGTPSCTPAPCNAQPTAPTNGYITSSAPYSSGNSVTFACNSGYQLVGASNGIKCNLGSFVANPGTPSCTPAPCNAQPTAPTNGYVASVAPYNHLQSVTFACTSNFTLASSSGIQCQFGVFVGTTPTCLAKCLLQPTAPLKGNIVSSAPYTSGTKVNFTCNAGCTMFNNSVGLTCQNGTFFGQIPTCLADCPLQPDFYNGIITSSSPYASYKNVTFVCNSASRMFNGSIGLVCYDGQFVGQVPVCLNNCMSQPLQPYGGIISSNAPYTSFQYVNFSCNAGRTMFNGSLGLRCYNGTFVGQIPTCLADCPSQPQFYNGVITSSSPYISFSNVTFSCNVGSTMFNGSKGLTCYDGQFVGQVPLCLYDCANQPPFPYGGVILSNAPYKTFQYVNFSCNAGRTMFNGSLGLQCYNGTFVGQTPTCLADCPSQPQFYNGVITSSSPYISFSNVTFSCNMGSTMFNGSKGLSCYDGQFIGQVPVCLYDCANQPPLPYGGVILSNAPYKTFQYVNFSCQAGRTMFNDSLGLQCYNGSYFGQIPVCLANCATQPVVRRNVQIETNIPYVTYDRVNFTCDSNYTMFNGTQGLTCEDGTFVGQTPVCLIACLDSPAAVANGYIVDFPPYFPDQNIRVICDSGYTLLNATPGLVCKDGQLDGALPLCLKDCNFQPSIPANAIITSTFPYQTYKKVEFECISGYTLFNATPGLTCMKGNFEGLPPVCMRNCDQPPFPSDGYVITNSSFITFQHVEFACNSGYTMFNITPGLTCYDGTFLGKAPICLKDCDDQPSLSNGFIVSTSPYATYKDVKFECDPGYVMFNSTPGLVCIEGVFEGLKPTCLKNCSFQPYAPTNGYVVTNSPYFPFQQATFGCNTNYTMFNSTPGIKCENGTFVGLTPECLQNCVEQPVVSQHTIITSTVPYITKEKVEFACPYGYLLINSDPGLTCYDGIFVGVAPECQPFCLNQPNDPPHGRILTRPPYYAGQAVQFTCNPGYTMYESTSGLICNGHEYIGTEPICMANCFQQDVAPEHGFIRSLPPYNSGQAVLFDCDDGYSLVDALPGVTCVDGAFAGRTPSCGLKCITQPTPPSNGIIVSVPPYRSGQSVSFACRPGFSLYNSTTGISCVDGEFKGQAPLCLVDCVEQPDIPANGFIVGIPPYSSYQTIQFECLPGYKIVKVGLSVICLNGTLIGVGPSCVSINATVNGTSSARDALEGKNFTLYNGFALTLFKFYCYFSPVFFNTHRSGFNL